MKILTFIKHFFDKQKDVTYNSLDRETLVRKMFPWIHRLDDKKTLDRLLKSLDPDIRKVLNTYYWSEVNQLIELKKYWEIIKYEWILKFISDLTYLYTNPNNDEWLVNESWR